MPPDARLTTALAERYALESELGHGGMATVYLARDVKHDRQVAVKVLRPELAAVLGRERFLAEIRLTAKLDHPHILTLLDSGESGGFVSVADAAFDISSNGTAVYLPGDAVALRAVMKHHGDGTESPLFEDRRGFLSPRVSPDGRSLAVEVHSLVHSTVDGDIWIYDLKSGSSRRLAGEGHATRPAWSPDGRRIAFTSWVGDSTGVYIQSADGGPAIRLKDGGRRINGFQQVSWTPDMRWVMAAATSDSTKLDIVALSTDTSQPPRIIRQTAANEVPGPVSHDGRWLSYTSDETGRMELYLQSMAGGPSWPVSTDGAVDPVWPGGGAELYYISGQTLVAARLDLGGVPRVLSRRTLPWPALEDQSGNSAHYDILPNGDVVVLRTPASAQDPVVLLNWFEELRRKAGR